MQDVPAMLKGADAAIVHVLQALGLRIELLRVWQDEVRLSLRRPAPPLGPLAHSLTRALSRTHPSLLAQATTAAGADRSSLGRGVDPAGAACAFHPHRAVAAEGGQ